MEDSSQNGKPEESITSMNQTKTSEPSKRGVFMIRGKGMPFEEFVEVCVKQFREAGLLKDEEPDTKEEQELQMKMFLENEASLQELLSNKSPSTTAPDTETISQAKPTERESTTK